MPTKTKNETAKSTHITMVVDRSGSMQSIQADAEGGVNSFLKEQKAVDGKCTLSFYEFDDVVTHLYHGPLSGAFEGYRLRPRGMTSLLDALGRAINETGTFLRNLPESERPEIVAFVVMTDGHENTSREFTKHRIKEMIEHQESKYSWKFTFLGAGLDVVQAAYSLGFRPDMVTTYTSNSGASVNAAYGVHSVAFAGLRSTGQARFAATVDEDGNVSQ